jgi:L,D-transpeptidase ErfK/SrfK
MRTFRGLALCLLTVFSAVAPVAIAQVYTIPSPEQDLVGAIETVVITDQETVADVAREYNVGHVEIRLANPAVEFWLPAAGADLVLPKRHILPLARRSGIVLNVPEMRLYYYPQDCRQEPECTVFTHPVSIGRMDWKTPLGTTHVASKLASPSWRPTPSIRREAEQQGKPLPAVVPPGPDNPLGAYALYLGLPSYRIHGTNRPYGVGMRVTHGCVRMYPEDIEELFNRVPVGTPVRIVNQAVKFGWEGNVLFIEVHPPLEEHADHVQLEELARMELEAVASKRAVFLDEDEFRRALIEKTGMPVVISQTTGR